MYVYVDINSRGLNQLFHIQKDILGQRKVRFPHFAIDDKGTLHCWYAFRGGKTIMKVPWEEGAEIIEGEYFAEKRASEKDLYSPFMDFMVQRYATEDISPLLGAVGSDINNLAACYRKIKLFHELRNDSQLDVCRLVITEIEYIFCVCRSLFDILQHIARAIWSKTKPKKKLAHSFADMALNGERARTCEELSKKYELPPQWASFYTQEASFFRKIRKYRDNMMHRSITPFRKELYSGNVLLDIDMLYSIEKGFAVKPEYEPFASFGVWKEGTFQTAFPEPIKVAPIKPVVAFAIKETLGAMDRFVEMLSREKSLPEEIAPGCHLFLRGKHIHELNELEYAIEDDVWYA